jgi:hypothetical protein
LKTAACRQENIHSIILTSVLAELNSLPVQG